MVQAAMRAPRLDMLETTSPSSNGVPDRLVLCPGGMAALVELKAPGKKPSPLQREVIAELEDMDIPAMWASTFEEAGQVIETIARRHDGFLSALGGR